MGICLDHSPSPPCRDNQIVLFAQREELRARCKQHDLTNACPQISFEVAHSFLANGVPTNEELACILANAAPRMRFMRAKLNHNPDLTETACLIDVLTAWKAIYEEGGDEKVQFQKWFPNFKEDYIMHWEIAQGSFSGNPNMHIQFKESVENRLKDHERCAVSIYLKGHYITGCFDTEVRMLDML